MNSHQERLLKLMRQRPRSLRECTHVENVSQAYLSAPICEMYLQQLVDEGFCLEIDDHYYTAPKGLKYLEEIEAQKPEVTRPDAFTGTVWRIRQGGEQHRQYPSRGMG